MKIIMRYLPRTEFYFSDGCAQEHARKLIGTLHHALSINHRTATFDKHVMLIVLSIGNMLHKYAYDTCCGKASSSQQDSV